ncbi:MAG: DUF3438 family protein [Parahaliea sp.]
MTISLRQAALALMVAALLASSASAETLTWRKVPIRVNLVTGVEQTLILPQDAAVGLPPLLSNGNVFRTLATGGALYWTALEPFDTERIQVRLASGEFLLFDVSALTLKVPPAQVETLQVVMDQERAFEDATTELPPRATLFEMIRYAAQSIYSPARLVAPVPGVRPVPVGLSGDFGRLYDEGQAGLIIQPYKAWAAGDYYVTAFVVTNERRELVTLDNRRVRHTPHAQRTGVDPHFVASVFYQATLPGRGQGDNRTTLFIVTDRPIRSVIREV